MSLTITENLNFIRISSPKDWYFDPTQTADLLKGLHSAQEMFVLETIATPRGLRFFVRTESGRSGARSHLKSALGSVMAPGRTDPLLLSRSQGASVRTLHLREHTALPSARYSENDTMRLWNTVARGVKGDSGEAFSGTSAVRVVLQPAPADWYGPYVDHFRSDRTPGAGGIASRLGLSGPPDRSAHVDRDLAASKSLGLAFYLRFRSRRFTTIMQTRGVRRSPRSLENDPCEPGGINRRSIPVGCQPVGATPPT